MRSSRSSDALAVEFALLFFALPVLLAFGHFRFPKLLLLLLVAWACWAVLRRTPGFDRRLLWNVEGFRKGVEGVLLLFLASVPLFAAGVLLFAPQDFLDFPRRAPLFWGLVMVLYPLVSAYPQEVIYRAFLFERYRSLFRTEAALTWASALAFGFLHILYGSVLAVALTVAGGYLFARTYRRSRSLLLSAFQHGLYGCLMFTIGLGHYFYRGHTF